VLDLFEDAHLCVLGKSGSDDHLRENQGLSGLPARLWAEGAARNSSVSALKRLKNRTAVDGADGKAWFLIIFDRINGLAEYHDAHFRLSD
jgi:hypothetical protein